MTRAAVVRCFWARDPLDVVYHDREWGMPVRDDRRLFEFLLLEGAQAGLSWVTILRKRAAYRRAFADFDPHRVARFGPRDVRRLLADAGIVRNRAKIAAAVANARAFLAVVAEHGSFASYLWRFVGGRPLQGRRRRRRDVPWPPGPPPASRSTRGRPAASARSSAPRRPAPPPSPSRPAAGVARAGGARASAPPRARAPSPARRSATRTRAADCASAPARADRASDSRAPLPACTPR